MKRPLILDVWRGLACAVALASATAHAQGSPYAGQQARPIKSLSQAEVDDLLAGQGSGLAKAAELNGYPGPAHVLEHAAALMLSEAQREATAALMNAHKAKARALGQALVEAERGLDRAFADGSIDAGLLTRLTRQVAARQAELRAEHLRTHLEQTALLSAAQVRRYAQLRGYAGGPSGEPAPASHHPKHHGGPQ